MADDGSAVDDGLSAQLDRLVDRAPSVRALLDHRLGVAAARRWRALGRDVPDALASEEHFASAAGLAAPVVLERVLAAYGGPVAVLKGPEVACRYPDPTLRPHHDLDLLVEDAPAAQDALLRAGCEVRIRQRSAHHELPLVFPDLPLVVELHSAPLVPAWTTVRGADVLSSAVPSRWAVGRALAPAPEIHAVLLAAHSWVERPLRRVLDLADVHVLLADADRARALSIADGWALGGVMRSTLAAADATFAMAPTPWTLRTWARNLPAVRERTRLEALAEHVAAPFAALPATSAWRESARELVHAQAPGRRLSLARRRRFEHPALRDDPADR